MLDSLVRVSRRVGWATDRFATDPRTDGRGETPVRSRSSRRALRAVLASRTSTPDESARAPAGLDSSVPRPANTSRGYNTRPPKRQATFPPGLRRPENRSWRSARGKCTPVARRRHPERSPERDDNNPRATGTTKAEFRGSTMRPHPFTSVRFHVLLNSLFKVLFNFPSRYLSAIGLVPVFSLRWSLPPTLGCILKQPDS